MKNLSVILFLMCVPFLISCDGSDSDDVVITNPDPIVTTEELIDFYTGEKRGSSELTRSAGQISFEIETSNLIPGHVYQIVCSVFNKPENCTGPCDFNDNDNVEVVGFVMAGKTVNSSSATFEGTLKESDINSYNFNSTISNGWGGLQNAMTATIRLDVRSQGPAQNGLMDEQANNWGGGCSYSNWDPRDSGSRVPEEIGECAFIQLSSHVTP